MILVDQVDKIGRIAINYLLLQIWDFSTCGGIARIPEVIVLSTLRYWLKASVGIRFYHSRNGFVFCYRVSTVDEI